MVRPTGWVVDMRHYIDEDTGDLPEVIPERVLSLAIFFGAIVAWVTDHLPEGDEHTNVPCRRSPGRRRCRGDIIAQLDRSSGYIVWQCPLCGDHGMIHGWEVTVQIAHMAGAGDVEPSIFGGVLDVFVDAIQKRDPRMKNVWFDVTSVAAELTPEKAALIVKRIRELGLERMLFGSDAPAPNNVPRLTWAAFKKLPLTDAEFRTIETNVAPYLR